MSQRKEAESMEDGWQAPGPDDLLLEGEEGEYFLELLMRKASPERPKVDRLTGDEEDPGGKTAPARGKDKKKNRKKALKEKKAVAESGAQREEKSGAGLVSNQEKRAAPDLLSNPEAKGRGLTTGNRAGEEPAPSRGRPQDESVPDRRRWILEVRHSEALDNLGSGNLEEGGIGERVEKGEVSLQAT
jgi:hypothetical protein